MQIPRFAFEKFPGSKAELTTQMKSVGEAMAIGRTFQARLLCIDIIGTTCNRVGTTYGWVQQRLHRSGASCCGICDSYSEG